MIKIIQQLLRLFCIFSIGFTIFLTVIGAAAAQNINSTSERSDNKDQRIAALPVKLYNPDISSFEKITDLSKRYSDIAYKFALLNGINYIITSNVIYSKDEFTLDRDEILTEKRISINRFINPAVYLIDATEILKRTNQSKFTAELEDKFLKFSKISGVDVVLNRAIYASDLAKITKDFLEFNDTGKLPEDISSRLHPTICSLSVPELLKSNYARRLLKIDNANNRSEFYSYADRVISEFARKNKIDLILDANPQAKFCDITDIIVTTYMTNE